MLVFTYDSFSLLSYNTQNPQTRIASLTMSWTLSNQSSVKKLNHRFVHGPSQKVHFLIGGFLLQNESRFVSSDEKINSGF